MPQSENLRALVDALKTFLGFGDRLNRSNPEILGTGCVKRDADTLPAILDMEQRAAQDPAETEILRTFWRFKKTVWLGGSEEVDNRFDADGEWIRERLIELKADFAGDFATVGGGAERKAFREGQPRGGSATLRANTENLLANELGVICG